LLGLGLSRSGRKEDARRTWEKALALQPDYPEALERLVLIATAQNRLAEAAQLAERLSHCPGWELRGDLDQGALLAELSDPGAAAVLLKRALWGPQSAQLDRPALARYRKLLARTMLRIGDPAEARRPLAAVLRDGPDPEASWLLSRASLQQGNLDEAATALAAAGRYRDLHPLEPEPSPYVGETRCSGCHSEIARSAHASRHTTTLVRGAALLKLPYPDGPLPDPGEPTVTHSFYRHDGQVRFETHARDRSFQAVVAYAFGSLDRYISPVGRDAAGRYFVLRLSHYQTGRGAGWGRTTGHTPDAEGGEDFLGKPLDPSDGIRRCLFCHSTDPNAVILQSGPAALDQAIGCERCHGPGGNHLRAIAARFPDLAIVNTPKADAEGRLRLCGQCHSLHQESALPRTDPYWIRFQATGLAWSRCYTESDGSFDCMTCHDAHHDGDRSARHHDERCLDCHGSAGSLTAEMPTEGQAKSKSRPRPARHELAGRASSCPVSPANGCVGCHMPSVKSKAIHATFTDHYIRVH
jgi:tetratricopeptide (TPR) repeat protein